MLAGQSSTAMCQRLKSLGWREEDIMEVRVVCSHGILYMCYIYIYVPSIETDQFKPFIFQVFIHILYLQKKEETN